MPEPDREAYEAAERLVREAQERAEEAAQAGTGGIPRSGWRSGSGHPPGSGDSLLDLSALFGLLDSARGTIPPELARQLADALRELLVAIRAVLDYLIDRLEAAPAPEREVEDIPIR